MNTNRDRLSRERKRGPIDADALAVDVLGFLAEDVERLQRFLALTGFDAGSLRHAASQPGFTGAVLGYLASDEALLIEFAHARGLQPEAVGQVALRTTSPWQEG